MHIGPLQRYDQPGAYGQPSRVRYGVIAASTLMAILLYLDRFCIGIAEPFIRQDLGLSKQQMGIFMSAFFWPYALPLALRA